MAYVEKMNIIVPFVIFFYCLIFMKPLILA